MTPNHSTLFESSLKSLKFLHRGKVRDLYAVGTDRLLVIQTDRLSAFDVIMPDPIPEKGRVLTEMSFFWFRKLGHVIPNHLTGVAPETVVAPDERGQVAGRAMVVRKLKPLMIEAVVRGYIIGSGWKDYQKSGMVCGIKLPAGLKEAELLPEVIFTPATKAPAGSHDENISFAEAQKIVGAELAAKVRAVSIRLYSEAAAYAKSRGIIIADTKFEFGTDGSGKLILIDEILTPDSSRFWDASDHRPGRPQASYDKQFVRDWLETRPWDKTAPGPELPPEVVAGTRARYVEAFERITGASFERYVQEDVIAP